MEMSALELAEEHLVKLDAIYERFAAYIDNVKRQSTPKAVDMYVTLKNLSDHHEALGKQISQAVSTLKQDVIPNKFENEGVSSFTSTAGYRVTVSVSPRASMVDKDGAMQWLRDNGLGAIVTETVNASTLSATAKSMLEDGKELPEELFKVYLQPSTSVTKTKKAS